MPPWASSRREYTGLTLSRTRVHVPRRAVPTYKNGQKCAAGTPDAGQKGVVRARSWILSTATGKSGNELKQVGGRLRLAARPTSSSRTVS